MSTYARLNHAQRVSAWAVLYVLLVNLLAPVGLLIPVQNAAAADAPNSGFLLLCTPYGNQIVSYDDLDGQETPTASDNCQACVLHHLLDNTGDLSGNGLTLAANHASAVRDPHSQHANPLSAWRLGFAVRAPPIV